MRPFLACTWRLCPRCVSGSFVHLSDMTKNKDRIEKKNTCNYFTFLLFITNHLFMYVYMYFIQQMVNGISSALSNAKSIKMVSSGDSGVGAEKLTKEVMEISSSVPTMVKNLTGIDLLKVWMVSCTKPSLYELADV